MERLFKSLHVFVELREVQLELLHIDFLCIHSIVTLGEEPTQCFLQQSDHILKNGVVA